MQRVTHIDEEAKVNRTAHDPRSSAPVGHPVLPRVMLVHNYYQQGGGEDTVVENELQLLLAHGHDATLYSVHNNAIVNFADRVRVFREIGYSRRERDAFAQTLDRFRPDIVHVHNFFPLLTTSVYDACRAANVPVVQTLHNFRIACAGPYLLRNGRICTKCVDGSPYWGTVHRCYRESFAGSLAVSRMIDANRRSGTWNTKVERFIALTSIARDIFIRAGVSPARIVVKANFSPDPGPLPEAAPRSGALYVGRLSPEKGVREMIEAWRQINYPLRVVGDGPLAAELRAVASPNVTFLGRKPRPDVTAEMRRAAFLVSFSKCLEGFPVTIPEAFAVGLPAVVSNIGALAEIVDHGITGIHVPAGDAQALADAVRRLAGQSEQLDSMSRAARAAYIENYGPDRNYSQLRAVYEGLDWARGSSGHRAGTLSPTA